MKHLICMLLCLASLCGLVGCAFVHPTEPVSSESLSDGANDETETVELDWYVNFSWFNTAWEGSAVGEELSRQTGVELNFQSPDGSEAEKLEALIAGNNLPDLVTLGWWEPQLDDIIDGGLAYALNELADEYAPYFWEVANPSRIAWYTHEDGDVYCYPNSSVSPAEYETSTTLVSNQTFLVRKDIYEALGCPDMTTPEGFCDAVRAAAEQFPTVDGKPLIPVGAHEFSDHGCDSFDQFLMNFLAIPYEKDGKAYDRYTDAEYKRWLLAFRQLGEEGLLTSDIFIDKRAQMEEKIADGRYFCMLYQYTDLANQQRKRYNTNAESIYIAVEGPKNSAGDDHRLPIVGIQGWTVTLISKNCEHPEEAIKLLSYMMSEEGQRLVLLGVEGEHYTIENGEPVLTEETQKLMIEDYPAYTAQIGGNNSYWMLQDKVMQDKWNFFNDPAVSQMEKWARQYSCYAGQYDMTFTPGSEAAIAKAKIDSIHGEMLPKLLLAESEAEFETLWKEYVRLRQENGLQIVLDETTEKMNLAKEKLGIE